MSTRDKRFAETQNRAMERGPGAALGCKVGRGLFKLRSGQEETSPGGSGNPGQHHIWCKGPEAGMSLRGPLVAQWVKDTAL